MATEYDRPDERLAEAIRGLRDQQPAKDLWPGIEARITAPPRTGVRIGWPVAIAAGLTLLLAGGMIGRQFGDGVAPATDVATSTVDPGGTMVLPAGFDRAEESLTIAIDELQNAYQEAAPRLDPATRAAITASLAALDSAIGDARSRAGSSPDDIDAARYLTRTMQRKLRVLETAATMATRS